jgi:hypothetical protein
MAHPLIERFVYSRAYLSLYPGDTLMQIRAQDAELAFWKAEEDKSIPAGLYKDAVYMAEELGRHMQSRLASWVAAATAGR